VSNQPDELDEHIRNRRYATFCADAAVAAANRLAAIPIAKPAAGRAPHRTAAGPHSRDSGATRVGPPRALGIGRAEASGGHVRSRNWLEHLLPAAALPRVSEMAPRGGDCVHKRVGVKGEEAEQVRGGGGGGGAGGGGGGGQIG
jgi:hypothetical protein